MKRFTVKELAGFCKGLEGLSRPESYAYGKENGVTSTKAVDLLRMLLGFTNERAPRFSQDLIERVKKDLAAGVSVPNIAEKNGLRISSTYQLLRRLKIEYKEDFWTDRKIMVVCQALKEGPDRDEERANKIGCKLMAFRSMKQRIKTRTHVKKWEPLLERLGF